jgi:hypothetical protein
MARANGFAGCWAFGHSMRTIDEPDDFEMPDSPLWYGAKFVIHRQCLDCGVRKAMAMNYRGKLLRVKYYGYRDGYLMPSGEGRREKGKSRIAVAVLRMGQAS